MRLQYCPLYPEPRGEYLARIKICKYLAMKLQYSPLYPEPRGEQGVQIFGKN